MKKGDAVQLTIIILALIVSLKSLEYLIGTIVGLVYTLGIGEYELTTVSPTIVSLLVTLLYLAICWQLLVKSKNIASFIYDKTNIGTSFKIISQPQDLLYILFIVTGFYLLIDNLPALVKALLTAFRTKAVSRYEPPIYEPHNDWAGIFLRLLLPLILLMAAKPLSNYFAKNVSDEPVLIGEDIGSINENEPTAQ